MQQLSFATAEHQSKKRVTRREKFLAEVSEVVPWQRLIAVIEPHYPTGQRGRPPIRLERMLRLYFVQQWYGLSDEALEDAVSEQSSRIMKKDVLPKSETTGWSINQHFPSCFWRVI